MTQNIIMPFDFCLYLSYYPMNNAMLTKSQSQLTFCNVSIYFHTIILLYYSIPYPGVYLCCVRITLIHLRILLIFTAITTTNIMSKCSPGGRTEARAPVSLRAHGDASRPWTRGPSGQVARPPRASGRAV